MSVSFPSYKMSKTSMFVLRHAGRSPCSGAGPAGAYKGEGKMGEGGRRGEGGEYSRNDHTEISLHCCQLLQLCPHVNGTTP
jgi:hypothetical protein